MSVAAILNFDTNTLSVTIPRIVTIPRMVTILKTVYWPVTKPRTVTISKMVAISRTEQSFFLELSPFNSSHMSSATPVRVPYFF